MHYVCWVSSWSPARRRQAKPRCTHRKRVERQWLTASCDTERAASSQAAVRASRPRRGGEREHHLAHRPGDDEAPGKCQGDGLEKIQARGRSLEHASAPAPMRVDDRPTCYILGSEQTMPCRRAHKPPLQRRTQRVVRCARARPDQHGEHARASAAAPQPRYMHF